MEKYEAYLPEVVFTDEMNACSCSCKGAKGRCQCSAPSAECLVSGQLWKPF